MPSSALTEWSNGSQARLSAIRSLAASTTPGSAEYEQAEYAFIVQLAAEFQKYCRELHRLVVVELMHQTATQTPDLEIQIRNALQSKSLSRLNATESNINQDFGQLGLLGLSDLAKQEDTAASSWLSNLAVLLKIRNAIAHGEHQQVAALLQPFTGFDLLALGVRWGAELDQLVAIYDRVVSIWLGRFLQLPRPW